MSIRPIVPTLLLATAGAAFAQGTPITPSEPNCAAPTNTGAMASTQDRNQVRAEGKVASRGTDSRSGQQCDQPSPPTATMGNKSRADVRSEARQAKPGVVEGGAAR